MNNYNMCDAKGCEREGDVVWCGGCEEVSYCSQKCLKQDWKDGHCDECDVYATHGFDHICENCHAAEGTKRCKGCQITRYCGEECYKEHWNSGLHNTEICSEIGADFEELVKDIMEENADLTRKEAIREALELYEDQDVDEPMASACLHCAKEIDDDMDAVECDICNDEMVLYCSEECRDKDDHVGTIDCLSLIGAKAKKKKKKIKKKKRKTRRKAKKLKKKKRKFKKKRRKVKRKVKKTKKKDKKKAKKEKDDDDTTEEEKPVDDDEEKPADDDEEKPADDTTPPPPQRKRKRGILERTKTAVKAAREEFGKKEKNNT